MAAEACGSPRCGALIDWALPDGRQSPAHPVDHASAGQPAGNLEVWRDGGRGQLRYRVMKASEEPAQGRHRGMSHFATCIDAAFYRRPRAAARK
jgi:hypothetical protein